MHAVGQSGRDKRGRRQLKNQMESHKPNNEIKRLPGHKAGATECVDASPRQPWNELCRCCRLDGFFVCFLDALAPAAFTLDSRGLHHSVSITLENTRNSLDSWTAATRAEKSRYLCEIPTKLIPLLDRARWRDPISERRAMSSPRSTLFSLVRSSSLPPPLHVLRRCSAFHVGGRACRSLRCCRSLCYCARPKHISAQRSVNARTASDATAHARPLLAAPLSDAEALSSSRGRPRQQGRRWSNQRYAFVGAHQVCTAAGSTAAEESAGGRGR